MFTLKPISHDSVDGALAKAERYRLLNEPHEAESICRDILEIDPANRQARISLILALTDEIPRRTEGVCQSHGAVSSLESAYDRAYYSGIAWERRAKAVVTTAAQDPAAISTSGLPRRCCFRGSGAPRPAGNDDAILRWNTCVRFLESHKDIGPKMEEVSDPILSE